MTHIIAWRKHPEYDAFLRETVPGRSVAEVQRAFLLRFGHEITEPQLGTWCMKTGVRHGGPHPRVRTTPWSASKGYRPRPGDPTHWVRHGRGWVAHGMLVEPELEGAEQAYEWLVAAGFGQEAR